MNQPHQTIKERAKQALDSIMGSHVEPVFVVALVLGAPVFVWHLYVRKFTLVSRVGFSAWALFQYSIGLKFLPSWMMLIGTIFMVFGGMLACFRVLWSALHEARAASAQDQARTLVENVLASKMLPVVEDDSLQMILDEFLSHRVACVLHEHRTSGASISMGYRNWFSGRLLTRSQRDMNEELYPVAKGILFISNQRIVFVGDKRSASIAHNTVLAARISGPFLVINRNNGKPFVFAPRANVYELLMFHRLFHTYAIHTPNLPEVLHA